MLAPLRTVRGEVHLLVGALDVRILKRRVQVRERLLHMGVRAGDLSLSDVALADQCRLRATRDASCAYIPSWSMAHALLCLVGALLLQLAPSSVQTSALPEENGRAHTEPIWAIGLRSISIKEYLALAHHLCLASAGPHRHRDEPVARLDFATKRLASLRLLPTLKR